MKKTIRERFASLLSREVGENTRRLLRGLISVGPLFIAARVLTAIAQIAAGRLIGPVEFGLATLILAASGLLVVPLQLSFAWAVVKFAALETTDEGRRRTISTNFWLQLAWSGGILIALLLLRAPMGRVLHLSDALYLWCLGYTGVLIFYSFVSSALLGVTLFDARGKVEFLYGAAVLLLFAGGYALSFHTFVVFIAAMTAALFMSSAACLYYLRGYIRPVFSRSSALDAWPYMIPNFVSSCGGVVIQSALPLILAAYLSTREIGYFGAYEMGTIGVMMVLVNILNSVLGPLASRPEKQKGAWKKFFILIGPGSVGAFIFFFAAEVSILKLIGKGYPINPHWVALFSAAAVADLLFFLAGTLVSLRDVSGAWIGLIGNYFASGGAVILSFWSIPRFGVAGAAVALIVGYGAGFAWFAARGWLRVRNDP